MYIKGSQNETGVAELKGAEARYKSKSLGMFLCIKKKRRTEWTRRQRVVLDLNFLSSAAVQDKQEHSGN